MELDRDGGPALQNDEPLDDTEKAEVRHVDGVREGEKAHGDTDDAVEGADEDTVEEIDPRELCKLLARPRLPNAGVRSLDG